MTDNVMLWVTSPSTAPSFTPVTVTVCGVFQLLVVNANSPDETVASPVSADTTEISTSVAGSVVRTTVKLSVVPASETLVVVFDKVIAAVSLSVMLYAKVPVVRYTDHTTVDPNVVPSSRLLSATDRVTF